MPKLSEVTCSSCKAKTVAALPKRLPEGSGSLSWECPACGHRNVVIEAAPVVPHLPEGAVGVVDGDAATSVDRRA